MRYARPALLALTFVAFPASAQYVDGWKCWDHTTASNVSIPGTHRFDWPAGVTDVTVEICGSGASGGTSQYEQLGGGGGGGARLVTPHYPRPASGQSWVKIHPGGAAAPANSLSYGRPGGTGLAAAPATFPGGLPYVERDATQFEHLYCYGGDQPGQHGGNPAPGPTTGAEGGTPGACYGAGFPAIYSPGSMGGASYPINTYPGSGINGEPIWGGRSACEGSGSNNNQGGVYPGGGGAPGNKDFNSGPGAPGRVCAYWRQ